MTSLLKRAGRAAASGTATILALAGVTFPAGTASASPSDPLKTVVFFSYASGDVLQSSEDGSIRPAFRPFNYNTPDLKQRWVKIPHASNPTVVFTLVNKANGECLSVDESLSMLVTRSCSGTSADHWYQITYPHLGLVSPFFKALCSGRNLLDRDSNGVTDYDANVPFPGHRANLGRYLGGTSVYPIPADNQLFQMIEVP